MRGLLDRLLRRRTDARDLSALEVMLRDGERLETVARRTQHRSIFRSKPSASRAADSARRHGFDASMADEEGQWVVTATHTIILNADSISRARHALAKIAAESGGVYLGWEADSDWETVSSQGLLEP